MCLYIHFQCRSVPVEVGVMLRVPPSHYLYCVEIAGSKHDHRYMNSLFTDYDGVKH